MSDDLDLEPSPVPALRPIPSQFTPFASPPPPQTQRLQPFSGSAVPSQAHSHAHIPQGDLLGDLHMSSYSTTAFNPFVSGPNASPFVRAPVTPTSSPENPFVNPQHNNPFLPPPSPYGEVPEANQESRPLMIGSDPKPRGSSFSTATVVHKGGAHHF